MIPKAQVIKAKIKWDSIKVKKLLYRKRINKMKRQIAGWGEIFASHKSDKRLISKNIKSVYKSIAKIQNNLIKNQAKKLNRCFSKRTYRPTSARKGSKHH